DKSLRLKPFPVEHAVCELTVWEHINRAGHVFCFELKHRCHCKVELCIALDIQIDVMRLDAECVGELDGHAAGILPKQNSRLRTHELRYLVERSGPQRLVDDCVVDIPDQRGNVLWIKHAILYNGRAAARVIAL